MCPMVNTGTQELSIAIHRPALSCGLRFPLHSFVKAVLKDMGIAIGQLMPNSYSTINTFLYRCFTRDVRPQLKIFWTHFEVRNAPIMPGFYVIMYRPNNQKWHELNSSNKGREEWFYITAVELSELKVWAPADLPIPKLVLTSTELADYEKLQADHTADEKFIFAFVTSEHFLTSIEVSTAPSSSTMKSKAEFIAEQSLKLREEELKKKKAAKESKSKSSRKRTRRETILKDEETNINPIHIEEKQVNTPDPKAVQLESTAEYPPTIIMVDTPPHAEVQTAEMFPHQSPAPPVIPHVVISNTGPIAELCSDRTVVLTREVGQALQVHEDVRKMTELSSIQRAGQASAHALQTHLWVEILAHDLDNALTELDSTKDDLKTARTNNLLWRQRVSELNNKVSGLESKVSDLEGKLVQAQNLYAEAQQANSDSKAKLDKEISDLKLEVTEAEERATRAEANWFTRGQDDRIRAAKEAGLEYKKILIDPRYNPCETDSSENESELEPNKD